MIIQINVAAETLGKRLRQTHGHTPTGYDRRTEQAGAEFCRAEYEKLGEEVTKGNEVGQHCHVINTKR